MGILRRSTSMVSPEAWEELDKQAKLVFDAALSARRVVDFIGPKGWEYAAYPLGKLSVDPQQNAGVKYGVHKVLPLVESRQTFSLDIWELDDITRGCKNPDLKALENAARAMAEFEEKAIYCGFEAAYIEGLAKAGAENAVDVKCGSDLDFLKSLAGALGKFRALSVQGPWTLVACPSLWDEIYTRGEYYPLADKIKKMTGGSIVRSTVEGASFLLSQRGGDLEFVVGQDLSLGYDGRDGSKVKFFFAETFTFNVVNPEAIVPLKHGACKA